MLPQAPQTKAVAQHEGPQRVINAVRFQPPPPGGTDRAGIRPRLGGRFRRRIRGKQGPQLGNFHDGPAHGAEFFPQLRARMEMVPDGMTSACAIRLVESGQWIAGAGATTRFTRRGRAGTQSIGISINHWTRE